MRFIILNGLPFLYAHGSAFACRWDDNGLTIGAEVEMASAPDVVYSELSIKAKCECLDSIGTVEKAEKKAATKKKKSAEE